MSIPFAPGFSADVRRSVSDALSRMGEEPLRVERVTVEVRGFDERLLSILLTVDRPWTPEERAYHDARAVSDDPLAGMIHLEGL